MGTHLQLLLDGHVLLRGHGPVQLVAVVEGVAVGVVEL